jgi:ribosomal protein L12E/L44/L45/RPP1/RPP2
MKKPLLVCFAFTLLASLAAVGQSPKQDAPTAQDTAKTSAQEKQAEKPTKETKTVTGCLQKGDKPGEFSITGDDGKVWGLHSKSVKLEQHVGHQVTVTGTVHHETKAEEKAEGQMEKAASNEEYGDLRVSELKMVSDTCTK